MSVVRENIRNTTGKSKFYTVFSTYIGKLDHSRAGSESIFHRSFLIFKLYENWATSKRIFCIYSLIVVLVFEWVAR